MEVLIDGHVVLIDEEDAYLLDGRSWRVRPNQKKKLYTKWQTRKDGVRQTHFLHRLILGAQPKDGKTVDHINGNSLDNRRENLRFVTVLENCQNIRRPKKTSRSGILGVWWAPRQGKWKSQIRLKGATIFLGYFDCKEEAARVYQQKKWELHPSSR